MQVGAIGFGAAEIGSERTTDQTVDALLGTTLDAGINVIDTAAMYGDSEEKIGRALLGRRNQFLLFTKCAFQQFLRHWGEDHVTRRGHGGLGFDRFAFPFRQVGP
jgi:aryl-alcohol dehydrogenase-like predicted oxidoreductase